MRKRAFDQIQLEGKPEQLTHPLWGKVLVFRDVVIAREMVQEYLDGRAWKPAEELEKAAPFAGPRWAISGRHPETGLLMDLDDIHGLIDNPRFVKNLRDHGRTERQNNRGIMVDLYVFKDRVSPNILNEILRGKRLDVSIGFTYIPEESPGVVEDGPLKGETYDYIQRDIFIDHLAFGIPQGRCPMPYCGIGADSVPSTTENAQSILNSIVRRFPTPELTLVELNAKIDQKKTELEAIHEALKTDQVAALEPVWFEAYSNLVALREAKLLYLAEKAVEQSKYGPDAEEKALEYYNLADDVWTNLSPELRQVLLKRVPGLDEPSIERARAIFYSYLEPQNDQVKAAVELALVGIEEGKPVLANDVYRKFTMAGLCWTCLDKTEGDYSKAPEDTPWDFDPADYTPEQLSYASAYVEIDGEVHEYGYTGEGLTKDACHLPHHEPGDGRSHGGRLVWRGVAAAGAAIMGARGAKITGKAAEVAKAHLEKHYREFEKTPPWEEEEGETEDSKEPLYMVLAEGRREMDRYKEVLGHLKKR